MTGINHAITGAVIAAATQQPALALPLAFASHFVLDSLPHFGFRANWQERSRHKILHKSILLADFFLLMILVIIFMIHSAPVVFYVSGFVAFSPDLVWTYRYIFREKMGTKEPGKRSLFSEFHSKIQKRETMTGIFVELLYIFLISALLIKIWP